MLPLFDASLYTSFGNLHSASDAANATSAARSVEEHAKELEARLNRLVLVAQSVWELLGNKNGLTQQQLLDEVNLLAQRKSEKLQSPEANKCPQCGRPMAPRLPKCIYCGATRPIETVFDAV